ncbi:MAG: hypothetical protein WBM98_04115, partial [Maribacter sp.]|uniref:hypothetical protein n=1 Tax=Maribacter sp. TaxID=1897614 RepID=UPI003C727D1F
TGNSLQIDIEGGSSTTVDLSSLVGTDDQIADEVNITDAAGNFTATEVEGALAELAAGSTDDQNLTGATLTGNSLQIDIEGGSSTTVDLSSLVGTDDQQLDDPNTLFNAGTNELTIALEDGGTATADLSALDNPGTDDQTVDGLTFNSGTGELAISLEDDGAAPVTVNLSALDTDTDDQQVDTFSFNAGTGELTLEVQDDGQAPHVADLSALDTNTTNTSLTEDGTNLILTDSDTNTVTIPLADLGTDDQYDDEVLLRTAIDVDDAEKSVAQGYVEETTVQEVINAIAPITSKAARIFYPPSIAVDASTVVNNVTIDLYQEYIDQFGSPTMASAGAPAAVPTYGKTELYYYVTYADPAVLNIDSISADGVMQYDVVGTPADYNSLINVVFVVK